MLSRKFLEELGIDRDKVEKIMAERGKEAEALKQKDEEIETLKEKNEGWQGDKTKLESRVDELLNAADADKSTIADLQKQLSDAELKNLRADVAYEQGLPRELADRLRGDDREALTADAKALSRLTTRTDPMKSTEPEKVESDPYADLVHDLNSRKDE